MNRKDVLLAALAHGAKIRAFEPVHVQKAMFLIDRHIPGLFDDTSRYTFTPYDYGPFDSSVYSDLDFMALEGLVAADREGAYGYRLYRPTELGTTHGWNALERMKPDHRKELEKIVDTILPLSFRQLVAAIYRSYPEMKVNSVFNG